MSSFRYETNTGMTQAAMVCSGSEGNNKVEMMRASRTLRKCKLMRFEVLWKWSRGGREKEVLRIPRF